jgi:DNA polymerase IV
LGVVRRVIAHLDIDAFYASVELMRRPQLRGRPVIVSGSSPRAVVTTASYEARRYGVGSAMPTSHALRLCPQAVVIAPDFPAYRETSERVWAIVGAEVDVMERVGLDEAYLVLDGLAAPKAFIRRVVDDVRRQTGLTASVGIGPNKLVAKVASDCEKPAGLVALSREMACERFAGSPPRLLPGIGPKTAERLTALGITTLAALRAAEAELLSDRFGANMGSYLSRRAHFEDDSPVGARVKAVSASNETTFDVDVSDQAELERTLTTLSRSLCEGLSARGRRGRTIGIKVRLDDFKTVTRARTVETATHDPDVVSSVACELLAAYAPPRPVRLIGVRLSSFGDLEPEGDGGSRDAGADQLRLTV